jgi:hypothetical protein
MALAALAAACILHGALSRSAAAATPAPGALTVLPPIDPAKVINVAQFGTKGDGVTSDRKAIQAAIDSAQPGSSIYFPPGTYLLEEPVFVRQSNLTFWGEGAQSVLKANSVSSPVLDLGTIGEPLQGLVVTRLTFFGTPGQYFHDGVAAGGIQIFGPKGTVVQDCDFIGCGFAVNDAGDTGTTYGTRLENCRLKGWGKVGMFCNGGEQILQCSFVQDDPDLYDEHSSHGLYIHSGCTHILVQDTLIQNARKYTAQLYGRNLDVISQDIVFRNCTFKDCANGITIQGEQATAAIAKDVTIENCVFQNIYHGPALSVKQGDGIQILNNVIDTAQVGLQLGVWAPYEPDFTLANLKATGNLIKNSDIGIYALASNGGKFVNVTLSGNTVTNCKIATDVAGAPGVTVTP